MKLTNPSKLGLGLVAFAAIAGAFAQAQAPQHQDHATGGAAPQHGGMMPMDMSKHMAGMTAADAKLKALTAKMNAARGAAKVDATAAVVNELVTQQKQMRAMCMGMMSHMGTPGKAPIPADHSKHTGG